MKLFFRRLLTTVAFSSILLLSSTACGEPQEIEITFARQPETTGRIYIGGDVTSPGYYPLRDGDAVASLVESAGGTASDAPSELRLYVSQATGGPQRVDINRADSWLIQALPGVGETLATRIIDYRTKNGYFRSVNELTRVEGISTATLEKIKDLITVSD